MKNFLYILLVFHFSSCQKETFNINFHLIEAKITSKTKAIIPVSLFGQVANIDEINTNNIIKCKEILPKGSIVVFPSYTWHRVSPVTSGTRLSLVQWNLGPGFK